MEWKESTLLSVNGDIDVNYIENNIKNEEATKTVIFIHGFSDSFRSFTPLVEKWPNTKLSRVKVYMYSLRGHGETSYGSPSLETNFLSILCQDLEDFMNKLAIKEAIIVGHSLGSFIAYTAAASTDSSFLSSKINGICLIGSGFKKDISDIWGWVEETIANLTEEKKLEFVQDFQDGEYYKEDWKDTIVSESMKSSLELYKRLTSDMKLLQATDVSSISCPVCVVYGEEDVLFSEEATKGFFEKFTGSANKELHKIDKSGHNIHWHYPQEVMDIVTSFIENYL